LLGLSLLGFLPLNAQAAVEPLTTCAAEPTKMTLTPGDVVDCKINIAGDQDEFYFDGKAGFVFVLSLFNKTENCYNSSYPCPVATLYAPGSAVALKTFSAKSGTDSQQVLLPATGTYTIKVAEEGNNHTADYLLGFERLFPASPNTVGLLYGDFTGNQDLNPVLDQDFYAFKAYKDSVITLTLGDVVENCYNSSYPCPEAKLYAPDQTLVTSFRTSQSKKLTLTQEGVYTLHLSEYGNNDTDQYNLELQCITPPTGQTTCDIIPPLTTCNGLTPTIEGTAKSEKLLGTAGDDVIVGLGGSDTIYGLGGNDVICGYSDQESKGGNDTLLGGDGNDTLIGGDNSVQFGDAGNDSLKGGKYRDSLFGGLGDDSLDAQDSDDVLFGGAGNDVLNGGAGRYDICEKKAEDLAPRTGCEINETP